MPTALPDPTPFLDQLFAALHADGIQVQELEMDHLCYRVASMERYSACTTLFAQHGTLLAENMIGGRPIATYRLHQPFAYLDRLISVVELASPKVVSPYPEGYEHAEFVVPELKSTSDFLAFTERYPQLPWDLSDLNKATNADVRLRYAGFSVKFHRETLARVIAAEQREGVQGR